MDGGYGLGGLSSLQQTSLIIEALDRVGASYPKGSLQHWLNSKQQADGGFSLKSSSDMIDTYYSLAIFNTIKETPNNLSGISSFLQIHKSANGGYVFSPDSKSVVLESMYCGIESEELLGN